MAGKKTEYEIAIQVGGKVAATFGNSVSNVNSGFEDMANMAKTAAKMITAAFATVKVGQFVGGAIETYVGFEQSMANTAAIANATRMEYERLEQAAREMGKATTKTAEEAADALGYMMLAGWSVNDAIASLEPVLRLSEATQMDLARCSDLVTDSMSALGLSMDGLSGYLDMCTAANNNANTTAEALMDAFIGCGGAAKTVGADLNDMATALGILANNGTKGAQAGTAMNAILVRMTSKDVALKAMRELGVEVFNSAGEFRGLETVLFDVQDALSGLTAEQQTSYMSDIAGTNYYTEMGYLLDAMKMSAGELAQKTSDVDGAWESLAGTADNNVSAWDNLSKNLHESDGTLMNMAGTVTDTLQGAFSRLGSAADDAKISLADAFSDDLKGSVNALSEYIPELTQKFIDFAVKSGPEISRAFATITKGAKEVWTVISGAGEWVAEHFDGVEQVVAGIGGAIISYKVVGGLTGAAEAAKGFGKAIQTMKITNPWLLGITAAITAISGIAAAIKTAERQAVKSNLAGHFGEIALSMEDISKTAEYIVASDSLSKIHDSMLAFDDLSGIADSMRQSIDTVDKMNWKVSVGMGLSADENQSYISEVQNYVSQAQAYVEQQQYALNLNLASFAEGDLERQNIVDQLNDFYSGKYSELQVLGTQLNETVTEAFRDGLLDMDEVKEITELQAQMARIQEALATSDFDAKLKVMELQYDGAELDSESFMALQEEIAVQVSAAAAEYEETLQLRIANLNVMLEDGAINQDEYDASVKEFWADYREDMAQLETKALGFQTNTIMKVYGDEVEAFYEHMGELFRANNLTDYADAWENTPDQMLNGIYQALYDNDIDKSTKLAIAELLESLRPTLEQVEKLKSVYREVGKEIPAELQKTLSELDVLSAMTARKKWFGTGGDTASVWKVMESQIVNNDDYEELEMFLRAKGYELPEAMAEEMGVAQEMAIAPAIDGMYAYGKAYADRIFAKGFEVTANMGIKLTPTMSVGSGRNVASDAAVRLAMQRTVGGHADGGIFDRPHMAWFAEDGPEAAIPIDGSSNAVSLWEEVGRLLGVFGGGTAAGRGAELYNGMVMGQGADSRPADNPTDPPQFVFSPQITIEGSAGSEDIDRSLSMSMEQFREMMEQFMAEKARTSFG